MVAAYKPRNDEPGTRHRPVQREQESSRHAEPGAAKNGASYSASQLGRASLRGRGNAPVQTAVIQQMQQTYGNRAVQRFLRNSAAGSAPTVAVQRDTQNEKYIKRAITQAELTSSERTALPDAPEEVKTLEEELATIQAEWIPLNKKVKKKEKLTPDEEKRKTELDVQAADVVAKLNKAERTIAKGGMEADIKKAGKTVKGWFGDIVPDAKFLGVEITKSSGSASPGVHKEMLDHLRLAEDHLLKDPDLKCKDLADCAQKVELKTVSGLRPPMAATGAEKPSLHCYGLAVDINYAGSPYVGFNSASPSKEVIERATLLVGGKAVNVKAPPVDRPAGKGKAPPVPRTVSEQWEHLQSASDALKTYLSLKSDTDKLKDYVEALQTATGDKRDVAAWKKQIEVDHKSLKDRGDFERHTDPAKGGFMDLKKKLVVALVDVGGLRWGGQMSDAKDIMHFDWRNGTIKRS